MAKRLLPPIGFWSYARPDDELSGGQLSRLRSLIRSELQQQYGREPIQLFQDISAISHGSRWEGEIRRALDNSTFFIPILSPNFMQSDWCVQEVEIFRERQERLFDQFPDLPRTSRIFPIQYIDTSGVESTKPEVDQALAELQWFDFREFRHADFGGPDVRRHVSSFVTSVRDVLRVQVEQAEIGAAPPPAASTKPSITSKPATAAPTPALVEAPVAEPSTRLDEPHDGGGGRGNVPLIIGGVIALVAVVALVLFLTLRGGGGATAANSATPPAASQAAPAANAVAAGNTAEASNKTEAAVTEEATDNNVLLVGRWGDNAQCSGETWELKEGGVYQDDTPGRWSATGDRIKVETPGEVWEATIEWLEGGERVLMTPVNKPAEPWFICPA